MEFKTAYEKVGKNHYQRVHLWIAKEYGKASVCENKNCISTNAKSFQWALKKDCEYDFVRDNFMSLCCSCHRKYDDHPEVRRRKSVSNMFKKPWLQRAVVSTVGSDIKRFESLTVAAKQTGILHTSIANCLAGRTKTAGGFNWKYEK